MTATKRHSNFTPEDYLEIERMSLLKHEYFQGQLVAMAGVSKAHVIVTGNLSASLVNHLRGTGAVAYAADMKVQLPELGLFYYPDLAITCDDRDRRSVVDFILYPKLIIEVLSDSTEAFDRGDKFADYKSIETLGEYILVHQRQVLVEHFQRKSENLWLPTIYRSGAIVTFASVGFSYPIEQIYENLDQLV
jgi:Uma2 family endonuclease